METSAKICLLIDDDRDDQEIFTLALEQVDPEFRCVIANNGYEGLKYLANKNNPLPRYIFLDLNMPLMNGKECLIEIKKLSFLRSVPVIIYSTSSLQYDVVQTRKLGAADFITKPPSIPVLSSKLLASIRALERMVPVEATLPKI